MKKTILKSLLLGAAALTALTASANLQVTIEDFEVQPGNTSWTFANVYVTHEKAFSAIELHFALIDGVTFNAAKPQGTDLNDWPTDEFGESQVGLQSNTDLNGNEFKVVVNNGANNENGYVGFWPVGRSCICRLAIKTDANFTGAKLHLNYAKSDYSDPTPGAPEIGIEEASNVDVCNITIPIEPTPLADIVASGVDNTEYVVADPLYVVTKSDKAHCVFVTDGPENGNWMKIYAEGEVYNAIADMEIIKEGTLKGVLSEASGNQQLTVTTAPTEGEPNGSLKVEPKEWNLAQDVPGSDDWHFAPKVNEVIALTGYWQDNAFSGYQNNGGQVVTASMAWCDTEIEMVSNGLYKNVVSAVQLKPTNGSKAESDLPYTKYIIYPTTVEDDNVVTGVENLKGDKAVVSVQYVNVAGQVANTPFQGVNMVVTRYADGSTVTTKVIK